MSYRMLVGLWLGLASVSAMAAGGPVGHWKLDGDGRDASGAKHGTVSGRGEFVDSIIAGGGKALWCEGVDTAVRVDGAGRLADEFTVAAWVCVLEARAGVVLGGEGWSVELTKNNALKFSMGGAARVETPADRVGVGQWYHVVVAGRRGGACAVYVNGEASGAGTLAAAAAEPAGDAGALWIGRAGEKGAAAGWVGLIDDVRVYARALGADDVAQLTDEGLGWVRKKGMAREPFDGRVALVENDVVALVGGEDLYAAQQAGYLETVLTLHARGKRVSFRNMAWEGDTVFEQWRILNFGPWGKQFERVGASVIVVQFGKMESLRGEAGLKEYRAAYEKLLDEVGKRTKRIVVVTPTPFEDAGPLLPSAKERNAVLAKYVDAMTYPAAGRGVWVVDLFRAMGGGGEERPRADRRAFTRDGVHLNAHGQVLAAKEMARRMGVGKFEPVTDDEDPKFVLSGVEELRQAVIGKNELWLRAWRPPNWAFLNGDRITQPSSRDHADQRVRWLPAEVQRYPVLVEGEERKIARLAKGLKE